MSVDWFRWWHGSVTDPKFGAVSISAKCSLPEVLSVWIALLEHASQSKNRGSIEDCPADEIAWSLRIGCETVANILSAFELRGMIKNGRIDAWERRQPMREDAVYEGSKTSSQRVREFRERKRNEDQSANNADETQRNADETHQSRQDTDTEKRREDQNPSGETPHIAEKIAEISEPAAPDSGEVEEIPVLALVQAFPEEKSKITATDTDDNAPARHLPAPTASDQGLVDRVTRGNEKKRRSAPLCDSPEQEACRATWAAYSEAYRDRYSVDPIRNARVNSAIKSFVRRIGADESPLVARYYLSHSDAFYARKCHDVGNMLADSEKLRTEWATQRQVTGITARQQERTGTMRATLERILTAREATG
jgi:hypothetical protein